MIKMVKEIFVCEDGIIIRYHKKRYVTHSFHAIHNGEMVKVSIDNKTSIMAKLWELKIQGLK